MSKNYFGITDIGKVRKNNEDTFIAEMVDDLIIVAAIDGVGGYEGGEIAARLAKEAILNNVQAPSNDLLELMKNSISQANASIYEEKAVSKDHEEMACVLTLSIVDLANNKLYYAHVGDSRLYLLRDNGMVKLTKDHSFVGYLEDSGRLSEEAAMRHPKRNEINKALGLVQQKSLPADYIDAGESPFLPGDIILLCSDGLTDMIDIKTITTILNASLSLEEKGKELIRAANNAGGKDNITAVLAQNDKPAQILTATRPAGNTETKENINPSNPVSNNPPSAVKQKKTGGANSFLLFGFIILLAITGWLMYKQYHKPSQHVTVPVKTNRIPEIEFLVIINDTSHNPVIPPGQAPIIISDTIVLQKDSLHIFGNGIRLVRDSAFTGPAFVVDPHSSYVMLDSITFENFNIGIIALNKNIRLKNVRFINCKIPVLYQANILNNQWLNGHISGATFYKDSTKK